MDGGSRRATGVSPGTFSLESDAWWRAVDRFELICVQEVLGAAGRSLLRNELGLTHTDDGLTRDLEHSTGRVCAVEVSARYALHEIDARGRMAHPYDVEAARCSEGLDGSRINLLVGEFRKQIDQV